MQKAVEGGFKLPSLHWFNELPEYAHAQFVIDPLFWQALGKALGWQKEIDAKEIGHRIRKCRVDAGLRQEELGKELGYSAMGISHFEHGVRTIRVSTIEKLSRFFKKEGSYFLVMVEPWQQHAHRFYDLILQGQPTDQYWKEILATKL